MEIGRHAELGEIFEKRDNWKNNLKIRIMPGRLQEGIHVYLREKKKEFDYLQVRQNL